MLPGLCRRGGTGAGVGDFAGVLLAVELVQLADPGVGVAGRGAVELRGAAGVGSFHSKWSWMSPNFSLVWMFFPPLESMAPSSTGQLASPPPSDCHWDRSFPSKSTTASDGAFPG